jgi:hypothetical protein
LSFTYDITILDFALESISKNFKRLQVSSSIGCLSGGNLEKLARHLSGAGSSLCLFVQFARQLLIQRGFSDEAKIA